MNFSTVKGYIFIVLSSLVLVTAVLITILQGGLRANFSVFGTPADGAITTVVTTEDGKNTVTHTGGVNTGMLMLFSAVGGIIVYLCMHLLFAGIGSAKRGREEFRRRAGTRLADLVKDARGG